MEVKSIPLSLRSTAYLTNSSSLEVTHEILALSAISLPETDNKSVERMGPQSVKTSNVMFTGSLKLHVVPERLPVVVATTTLYKSPSFPAMVQAGGIVKDVLYFHIPFTRVGGAVAVVPAISTQVTPPSVLRCHLYSTYVL